MNFLRYLGVGLAALAFAAGPVEAATCQAGALMCGTTMPLGGYCECTAHGATEGGEVVASPVKGKHVDATAGGCGAQPNAPGCR